MDQIHEMLAQYPVLQEWYVVALIALISGWLLRGLFSIRALRSEISTLRTDAESHRAAAQDAAQAQTELARMQERATLAQDYKDRLLDTTDELRDAERLIATLNSELKSEKQNHVARVEELRGAQEMLERRFDELARKALDGNAERFLTSVTERFEKHKQAADADLGARQKGIETLLGPIRENLTKFERQTQELEKAREGAYQQIRQQVVSLAQGQEKLTSETHRLVSALRAPKTRGNWGEFQLRQVVEMAGMVDHVDFHMEKSVNVDGQRQRPDATINMPGGKKLVIDAKTSLDAYLTAAGMDDGPEKQTTLGNHARQLRTQMRGLAAKSYFDAIAGSPDFVIMFIPGEAFYSAALSEDPSLFEDAIANKVIIATPTTLIALMKSVAYGWQQDRMSANAQEATDLARELYKRLSGLAGKLEKLGSSISNTVRDYNGTIATVETRVLSQARKFENLSIAPQGETLGDLPIVDTEVRSLDGRKYADDTE
ncbi:DNA recombination protein RmuC [Monaibacterium marinum]|uniref:DNA recombination protein RmuC homolog n=1 Tax=Pontivivens marinum TaxID=1690039 RepID=A0A2C9CQG1_9RHOB|nr:DNA recombination protein RmuC [Monaibacterium marinum]SOH93448.1 DNA recombination protein RmuC [Monaibacterium marinum]